MPVYCKNCQIVIRDPEGKFCHHCGNQLITPETADEKLEYLKLLAKRYAESDRLCSTENHERSSVPVKPGQFCPNCASVYAKGFSALTEALKEFC